MQGRETFPGLEACSGLETCRGRGSEGREGLQGAGPLAGGGAWLQADPGEGFREVAGAPRESYRGGA